MNFSEKIKLKILSREQKKLSETQESSFEVVNKQVIERFRAKRIEDINNRASRIKTDGTKKLDIISHSYELSKEDVAILCQETKVNYELDLISREIDNLAKSAIEQIGQIGQTEKAEEKESNAGRERTNESLVESTNQYREVKDFSKKYASMSRDILAGQLRRLRTELFEIRASQQDLLRGEISEIKKKLEKLESEYSQLEQRLDQEKNNFLSRLFRRGKISKLEQNLQERKATIDDVRKNVGERYKLLDEVSGLTGAEQDRAEIRRKLDEFYKNQEEIRQKFESEQDERSILEISKRENVFFIHGMSLVGGLQQGSEYNNAFIKGNAAASKTKLELIIGLEPTLSCSTIRKGDTATRMAGRDKVGVILGRGRVLYGKEADAYTVAENSPFIRRSKDASKEFNPLRSDIQQNPKESIKRAIEHKDEYGRDMEGYNEFVVENPEVAGLFFDYETYQDMHRNETTRAKIEELQKLAQEFDVPLYTWKDGKMQVFEGLTFTAEIGVGQEITFSDLEKRMPQLSPEDKKHYLENVVAENPFKINTEAQRMYSSYVDGEMAYQILIEKDAKKAGMVRNFRTNYALVSRKFNEEENRVEVSVNSLETYLQEVTKIIDKHEKDAKEAEEKLTKPGLEYRLIRKVIEDQKDAKDDAESVYAQVYAIGEAARGNGDIQTFEAVQKWLIKRGALERMQKFVADRIDGNGQLKFIFEKDVPKEIREILASNTNIDSMKKVA
jgi:hypothetical protein